MTDFESMIIETFQQLDLNLPHFNFALSYLSDRIDEHNKENGFEDDRELLEWDRLAANARILSTRLAKISLLSIENGTMSKIKGELVECPNCNHCFDSDDTFEWKRDEDGSPTVECIKCPSCGTSTEFNQGICFDDFRVIEK